MNTNSEDEGKMLTLHLKDMVLVMIREDNRFVETIAVCKTFVGSNYFFLLCICRYLSEPLVHVLWILSYG